MQVRAYAAEAEHVRLDGATMCHLDILKAGDGSLDGTLLQVLDHCSSHSGRRLLRAWLCRPLASIPEILRRQRAVLALAESEALREVIHAAMQEHKDLTRCVASSSRSRSIYCSFLSYKPSCTTCWQ
jgi:DNA mismatch repair ATPase MutS